MGLKCQTKFWTRGNVGKSLLDVCKDAEVRVGALTPSWNERVPYTSRMFILKLLLSAYFWSLIMSSVISKRWLECFGLFQAYYFWFIKYWAQNHGVGHECVFQRGIPVKWWSAESVCHLCLMLEDAHKKELSWHTGVSPISNLYTRVSREAAILGSGWEEFARAVIWWGGRNGRKQSWIDTWQCCDRELEVAAITVVLSNSLLLVFFLLVITLGLNMWGKNLNGGSHQNQQICV